MDATTHPDVHATADYLDVIARAIFRSGMSREVVDRKWPAIRAAFHEFEPDRVASLGNDEIDEIAANPDVIRNRRKIEAVIANAGKLLEIDRVHGGFAAYLASFPDVEARYLALRRDFKHLGDFGSYFVLYVTGEKLPPRDEWVKTHAK